MQSNGENRKPKLENRGAKNLQSRAGGKQTEAPPKIPDSQAAPNGKPTPSLRGSTAEGGVALVRDHGLIVLDHHR